MATVTVQCESCSSDETADIRRAIEEAYNKDDVVSTFELRQWLMRIRPQESVFAATTALAEPPVREKSQAALRAEEAIEAYRRQLLGSLPELDSMAVVTLIGALEEHFGIAMQIHDTVATTKERAGRADCHARRVFALVAQDGKEQALRVWEAALFHRLDPTAIYADRNVMFSLAGNRARVTADALLQINDKAVVGHAKGL